MSDIVKMEKPDIFINEHEMYVLTSVYKVPKMVRDTFRALFESAVFRNDCLVVINVNEENMRKWTDKIGIRASAVKKRIAKLLEWRMLTREVSCGEVVENSYIVPTNLFSFEKTYTRDHNDDVLVVHESMSDGWENCRFPKFINAMSWYETFDEETRRVFSYSMAHVTNSRFGEFIVVDDDFLDDASRTCLLTTEQVEGALETMESHMLLLETRKGVFTLNPEKMSIGVPWNSVVAIDAEFKFNKFRWSASFSYINNASQTE